MEELSLYHLLAIFTALVFISKHLILQLHLSKPLAIPILGHLHLLRNPIHQSLASIAAKHGHVLLLRFGSHRVLVVSSPSAAEECFTKNDIIFANRPRILTAKYFGYDSTAFAFGSYTPRWRAHRRFTSLHALSPASSLSNLSSELHLLLRGLFFFDREGFQKTEIRSWFFELKVNLLMGMITGKRYHGEEKRRLRKLVSEMFLLSGASSMEDFVPLAKWLGFSSLRRRIETAAKEMDEFLQGLIEERRKLGKWKENNSSTIIIDTMLALQEKEPEIYSDVAIKGIIVSLFTAGTETSSGTMEWTMALLVNHPEAMKKVKDEIGEHVGRARLVMDSDISKLRYLNNVIKETLRLFPPGPLLVPHESSEDCTVAGLHVPKGTMLLVNVYAMQRDPELWEDPLEFKPGRFDAESKGDQGYKYNPFGSGRRRCPGETMAWKVMGLTLSTLIQCFQWERVGEELVDLSEGMGLTMPMATPLEVMYNPCPEMLGVLSQL
ncbi:hypothetical protein J5N97_008488 [Dioscorea zingiberensis]|uniref:Cytochrome P450 n=1 Tax=Dioscorea zingiberensis TaxID=325984 RepID=A0A9D5CVU4_9LILI|nr:hypothetical protein J5N97_008488 [Dioscorea zingiberensis]